MMDGDLLATFERASAGDQDAWTQLVADLSYPVHGWLIRAGANHSDLDDLGQAVWLKVWLMMRRGIRFGTGAELCGYIKRTAERTVIDAWDMAKRRPQVADNELRETGYVQVMIPLAGLTRRQQRLAAMLWYGYSIAEIAAMLGITESMVYKRRVRLREAYYAT